MQQKKLTPKEVKLFIRLLRSGYLFNNGLVGNISYYYQDGRFVSSVSDTREPNEKPYIRYYNEKNFQEHLQGHSMPDFVYDSLIQKIKELPMKKLYLIRHAKSSWKDTSLSDYDRPLNKRGEHNSLFMGERLAKWGVMPDIILSSSARRAYLTAKNIAKMIGYSKQKIHFTNDIYEASLQDLLQTIQAIDNAHQSAFLIGHNPSLNMLLDYLVPDNFVENIVTTGIVELELNIDKWEELSPNTTQFIAFEYPKKYL